MVPQTMLLQTVLGLVQGPLDRSLEAHVGDPDMRRRLAAELQKQLMSDLAKAEELGAGIVLAEAKSEHWLARSWRPALMLLMMGFLVLAGLLLPLVDLIAGGPVRFEPHWQLLPPQFWDFLAVGMGGYIGGRSLEKVAERVFPGTARDGPDGEVTPDAGNLTESGQRDVT